METEHPAGSVDLWAQARGGDPDAMQVLVAESQDRVRSRIRLMMGTEARRQADSVDFSQQVVVEALRARHQFDWTSEKNLLRWMTTIARNSITDAIRKKRARALESLSITWGAFDTPDGERADPLSQADRNERVLSLVEALEELPDDYRKVIELRNLDELRFREIGTVMSKSEDTARKLHTRAMVHLGRRMASREKSE